MAAAEARAVWQRAVNRCFVQEDAKRAPKLACCQSSSSASTKQVDSGSSGPVDLLDRSSLNFMPLNQSPRFPNLPPDTRWWVHMQPGYLNQKGLNNEQINPLEPKMEISREEFVNSSVKDNKHVHAKGEQVGSNFKLKAFECDTMQAFTEFIETRENYDFASLDNAGFRSSKKLKEFSFDQGSSWNLQSEKMEPWWKTTDKAEIASLISQRSLDYFENCDLPTPQKMLARGYPYGNSWCFDCDGLSSLDQKSQPSFISNLNIRELQNEHLVHGSENSFSHDSETGLSKAELLEALCHSQTRAREAENAAKEAYAEKERLMKLLFKQASQLFAYKQWFQLLQLETLCLQIKKNSDRQMQTLPWMPCEARKVGKKWQRGKRIKRCRSNPEVTKYVVAFALGLSLVGAGLLLGWNVGWMLPFLEVRLFGLK